MGLAIHPAIHPKKTCQEKRFDQNGRRVMTIGRHDGPLAVFLEKLHEAGCALMLFCTRSAKATKSNGLYCTILNKLFLVFAPERVL